MAKGIDVSVLTCTGFRPEAFGLCVKWMERQRLEGLRVQWVIVDDERIQRGSELGRRVPFDSVMAVPGYDGSCRHTMPINVHNVIGYCEGDVVVFVEDDDWYHPNYLRTMHSSIFERETAIAGIAGCRYYHVGNPSAKDYRYRNPSYWGRYSTSYSSLCRTAISRRANADRLREICFDCHEVKGDRTDTTVDIQLWGATPAEEGRLLLDEPGLCISIKGLPGRKVSDSLHSTPFKNTDPTWKTLFDWIGEDANFYREIMRS